MALSCCEKDLQPKNKIIKILETTYDIFKINGELISLPKCWNCQKILEKKDLI